MFGVTKLRNRINSLQQEQTRHCQELTDLRRELTQLREDRDKLLDQLNLAIIETPAKYPERKLVSRTSTEYVEQAVKAKSLQEQALAYANASQRYHSLPSSLFQALGGAYFDPYYPGGVNPGR